MVQVNTTSKRSRDKRILHIILQCLFIAGVSRFVHAQDLTDPDIDKTLIPTLVDPESGNPTLAPTESVSPTDIASDRPSNLPSQSPTDFPTATVSPSAPPTDSFRPSQSPSVSPRPSSSLEPSSKPSRFPTAIPSISPSDFPSKLPSESPSAFPSVSPMPSTSPSESPSEAPSVSMQPSMVPSVSNAPSVSPAPSAWPSVAPTRRPSAMPTGPTSVPSSTGFPSAPSTLTSVAPTVTPMPTNPVATVIKNNIFMNLKGMPRNFTQSEKLQWTDVTQEFMWEFYQEIDIRAPGILPVNVTNVHKPIVRDYNFTVNADGVGVLEIEYLQAVDYAIITEAKINEEEWRNKVFLYPFQYDSQSYILDLINAFQLENWVTVEYVDFQPSEIPTPAPIETSTSAKSLQAPVLRALSASILLSAVIIVAFLFWDRHRKEKLYMETHAHDFETMEYDNAGQAMDWRNPYSPTVTRDGSPISNDGSAIAQDRAGLTTQVTRSSSPQTTASTVIAATPPGSATTRPSGGSHSLPPLPPKDSSQQSSSVGIGGHRITTTPPPIPLDHARHISGADTEITDLTYSDGGGGGRSDNGSDGLGGPNLPVLPTITDERIDRDLSWSQMKITEEETYSDSGSQDGLSTGENENYDNMGMTGFQMLVEELE